MTELRFAYSLVYYKQGGALDVAVDAAARRVLLVVSLQCVKFSGKKNMITFLKVKNPLGLNLTV
jgi:hypothetical protein